MKRNYYAVWKLFNKFFIRLDKKPSRWEDRLSLFVGHLVHHKYQSSTVKSYISAIKAVLWMNNIKITEDQYLLASLTRACRLWNDKIRTRLPIQWGLLGIILWKTNTYFLNKGQPYLALLYQTIFSTTYFGLLRVSEVNKGTHTLLATDVHVGYNKKKFLLVLQSSKTHSVNVQPQIVKITSTQLTTTQQAQQILPCPYQLLKAYADIRGGFTSNQEQFFVFCDKSPITTRHFSSCLKRIIMLCGFDCSLYGMHSLRAGCSSDLYRLGLSVETIKKLERWHSNAVFRYLKAWVLLCVNINYNSDGLSFFLQTLSLPCMSFGL